MCALCLCVGVQGLGKCLELEDGCGLDMDVILFIKVTPAQFRISAQKLYNVYI